MFQGPILAGQAGIAVQGGEVVRQEDGTLVVAGEHIPAEVADRPVLTPRKAEGTIDTLQKLMVYHSVVDSE